MNLIQPTTGNQTPPTYSIVRNGIGIHDMQKAPPAGVIVSHVKRTIANNENIIADVSDYWSKAYHAVVNDSDTLSDRSSDVESSSTKIPSGQSDSAPP